MTNGGQAAMNDEQGRMTDPNDRDRQQRELTAELHHAADLRAARKRRAEDVLRTPEADKAHSDDAQVEADVRRLLGADEEHTS